MYTEIDVPRLRQLALIVRHRSFSKAAESIGISQPALSKNIKRLERALGVQLLERGRFGADGGLTEAGSLNLEYRQ
jgi:molybdate transport repressor ModE-like protein